MESEAGAGQLVDLRDLLAACVAACELGCLEVPPRILSIIAEMMRMMIVMLQVRRWEKLRRCEAGEETGAQLKDPDDIRSYVTQADLASQVSSSQL